MDTLVSGQWALKGFYFSYLRGRVLDASLVFMNYLACLVAWFSAAVVCLL